VSRRYRLARLPAIALAIALPVGLVMLVMLLDVPIRRDVSLLVAIGSVILLAWAGGIWPGLIATLLLTVLFAGPVGAEQFTPPLDALSPFLFAVAALLGTGAVESLYRARWRVEAARDRARLSRRTEHALRAELESIVGAIGDGILVVDADGSISLMNQAAIDLVGFRPERVEGLLDQFAPSGNGATPGGGLAPGESPPGPSTTEYQMRTDDRRVEWSSFPLVTDGEASRQVIVLRDVTEARRRELLRDAFLSLLSHELRTPMTAVYGGATLLQRVGDQLDAATRNDLRADIVAEAERLSRLIDDLLVLTRVEGGVEVGQEPALLQHVVADVVAQDRRAYGASRIEITVDPGLSPVTGDETSIRQVTHNLITNAVKYSPASTTVDVRVQGGDGQVLVRILDRGRGLSDEDAAHIFEPFYRGRTTERMAPGLGIGLYVCQRLVEAMGGTIWANPRAGGGTEFGFALDVWPQEADDEAEPMEPAASPEAVRSGSSW
jgi:PAS domain S-box-containing protein